MWADESVMEVDSIELNGVDLGRDHLQSNSKFDMPTLFFRHLTLFLLPSISIMVVLSFVEHTHTAKKPSHEAISHSNWVSG